jgi:hypothetical protein
MLPCVPDDIEEFWDEIRPTREPAPQGEEAALGESLRGALVEAARRIGPRRISFDPTESRMLQGGDLVTGVRQLREEIEEAQRDGETIRRELQEEGGMDLDYRGVDPRMLTTEEADRLSQLYEGTATNPFRADPLMTARANLDEAARQGWETRAQRAGLRVSRDTIDALEQARSVNRAIRPTEVSGRGRDPRVHDLQRALAVLGYPSQVSLTIDGDGSRSLTITPDPEEFDVSTERHHIHITQGTRARRR